MHEYARTHVCCRELKQEIDANARILALFNKFTSFRRSEIGRCTFSNFCLTKEATTGLAILEEHMLKLFAAFGKNHLILIKLRRRFDATRKCLDLLLQLRQAELEPRHWTDLLQVLSLDTNVQPDHIQLSEFFLVDTEVLESTIEAVVRKVTEERRIGERLQKLSQFWEEQKYSFEKWAPNASFDFGGVPESSKLLHGGGGGTGEQRTGGSSGLLLITISDAREHLAQLEDDSIVLTKMLSSEFAEPFRIDLEQERKTMADILEVLFLWQSVQDDCLILARVLLQDSLSTGGGGGGEGESRNEAKQLVSRFEEDFRCYAKLMTEVIKKPIVKTCCLSQTRKGALLNFKGLFHQHRHACSKLLATTKQHLPRLNFISYQEILTVLGGCSGNEVAFQKAATRLFGRGVNSIGMTIETEEDRGVFMTSLTTADGEELHLDKRIRLAGGKEKIEVSLDKLVKEAHVTLEDMVATALDQGKSTIYDFTSSDYGQDLEQVIVYQSTPGYTYVLYIDRQLCTSCRSAKFASKFCGRTPF